MKEEFTFIQIITTGPNPILDRICYISLSVFNKSLNHRETYSTWVNPEKKISEKEFVNWSGISARSFYNAINALLRPALPYPCAGDNLALLAATTKKSIYVVNHNFIFRGNYDEFVTLYELKFPNGCKLDSKGRVIIER